MEMKFTKEIMVMMLVFSALFATIVYAEGFDKVFVATPSEDSNISGSTLFNITVEGADNASNATNATFSFLNYTSGEVLFEITVNSTDQTDNQTFNVTLNTAINLSDGQYNLSVNVTNSSGTTQVVNDSITNLTVDNNAPDVSVFNAPSAFANLSRGNQSLNVTVTDAGVGIALVTFNVTNKTTDETAVVVQFNATLIGTNYISSINVTNFEEGVQNLTVIANDSSGQVNSSESINFTVDRGAPNVTVFNTSLSSTDTNPIISFAFNDSLATQASCILYLNGENRGQNTTSLNSSAKVDIQANVALSPATYNAELNCTDPSGNVGNSSLFTVDVTSSSSSSTSSSSSGGGGSGGSSGGVSSTTSSSHKEIWASIYQGEMAEIEIDNENIAITNVLIDVTKDIYGPWLKIETKAAADLPSTVSELDKTVESYLYAQTSSTLTNDVLSTVSLDFRVSQDWLSESALTENQVALYHLADDSEDWEEVDTTHSSSDDDYAYYTASVSGFSYFAVAEGSSSSSMAEVTEEPEDLAEASVEEDEVLDEMLEESMDEIEEDEGKQSKYLWMILVVALLGLVGYYLYTAKQKQTVMSRVDNRKEAKSSKKKKRKKKN
jgi:PGF-pre-PGF domain-containing protein